MACEKCVSHQPYVALFCSFGGSRVPSENWGPVYADALKSAQEC